MGSIAKRLAERQAARAKAGLKPVRVKPTSVRDPEERRKEVELRVADIMEKVGKRPGTRDTRAHYEYQQEKAAEAKKAGIKGIYDGLCNRTDCLAPGAVYYNRGSYAFYCGECARMLNRVNKRDAEDLLGEGQELCIYIDSLAQAEACHVM